MVKVDSSWVASTSDSHTTASALSPGASRSALAALRDSVTSMFSTVIAPVFSMPSARSAASSGSAASRATSHVSRSPSGS